jgi:hypothetical protein
VYGFSEPGGTGVVGESKTWMGVYGKTDSTTGGAGVMGEGAAGGPGVIGKSQTWHGVYGETVSSTGSVGVSATGAGVYGKGGRVAAFFEGDVEVTGDLRLLNADCAEDFDVCDEADTDPGTVLVIGEDGRLRRRSVAYDPRVAGVVSGAGNYRPGLILDSRGHTTEPRRPIALVGKTWCKVDASAAPIEVGALLTTSDVPGHAMRATDQVRMMGSVIGKALGSLTGGRGLVPILVALQ